MTSGSNRDQIIVRKAEFADLSNIKTLVDLHRSELGFVIRGALESSVKSAELILAIDVSGRVTGLVHYRHRKDRQTTLYNIVVEQEHRRQQTGSRLVDALRNEAIRNGQTSIFLKCPESLPANQFYGSYGFTNVGMEAGKSKRLNLWQLDLTNNNI